MNLLDIDIKEYAQDIIDAYVEVYGQRHRDIITLRFNKICYIMYNTPEGMEDYVDYLEECKRRELSLKFLERIGIDISEQKEKNFSQNLDTKYEDLLIEYLGDRQLIFTKSSNDILSGIMAWSNVDKEQELEKLELEKIKFLNFYRDDTSELITKENFEEFCQTEEYNQILEKIKEYLKIYKELVKEYDDYLQSIDSYEKYVEEETKRKYDIEKERKKEFYQKVFDLLPTNIKKFFDDKYKNTEEKHQAFLEKNLWYSLYIEAFSDEEEKILNNTLEDEWNIDRESIYFKRTQYFINMEIEIGKTREEFKTYEEFYRYCIEQENVRKIIPSTNLANEIKKMRNEAYMDLEKDFFCTSDSFRKNIQKLGDNENNKIALYKFQKLGLVCITEGTNECGFVPLMLYTIRKYDRGGLEYSFLHEVCHGIESEKSFYENGYRCGFNMPPEYGVNPYNPNKLKYERMNETITDILCMESADILHKKGIYMFEPKEIIASNIKDRNTNSILKNLLKKFMVRYRDEIIDARIYGAYIKKLYDTIGKENYDELNDVINKVDYLLNNKGLFWKIKRNEVENPVYIEYQEQLERLDNIYENMEQHKSQNENNRHEGKITMSQLIAAINAKQKESKSKEYDDWGNKI